MRKTKRTSEESGKGYPKDYVPPAETQEHRDKRVAQSLKAFYGKAILEQWRQEAQEAHEKQKVEETKNGKLEKRIIILCEICTKEFVRTQGNIKYCSDKCKHEAAYRKKRKKK